MRRKFAVLSAAVTIQLSLLPALAAPAAAACDAGRDALTNCADALSDALPDVFRTERDEGRRRVETVGEAMKECYDCAMQRIKEGMDSLSTSADSNFSVDAGSNGK